MKIKNKRLIILFFLLITLILSILLMFYIKVNDKDEPDDEVMKEVEKMTLNFDSRVDKYNSFDSGDYISIGWLQVQGTNIDFPILDSTSSQDELEIKYSYGWRSPNYNSGENREVLIGHNIINVSSTPMLSNESLENFEALMSFSYYGFAKDNLYIQYTKDGKDELYAIYAISFYDYGYDDAQSISEEIEIKSYIDEVKTNSIYDYDIKVDSSDTLLTVKTCTRYFGVNEKQQFVIDARKVRDDEEIVKYNVETNDNFDKLINNYQKN